jgi:hypothetical protein
MGHEDLLELFCEGLGVHERTEVEWGRYHETFLPALLKIADPRNPCLPTIAPIYDEKHMVVAIILFLDFFVHINFQAEL